MEDKNDLLKTINQVLTKLNKRTLWILVIGGVAVCLSPWAFTNFSFIDFTDPNNSTIGSTIGGITAPVIGIVSALLIYVSFLAQIKANQIQIVAIQNAQKHIRTQEEKRLHDEQVRFIEGQFELTREVWNDFLNKINTPLASYKKIPTLTKKIIDSPVHLNLINRLLLNIDRLSNTLIKSTEVHEELKRRYVFSDILLLLNDETKDLLANIRQVLEADYGEDFTKAFTVEMINKVYRLQVKLNHLANKPEDQEKVIEILKAIDKIPEVAN